VVLLVVLLASLFAFRFFILFAAALLLSLDRVPCADDVGFFLFVPSNEPPSLFLLLLLKVGVAMLKKSTPDAEECSQLTPDVIVCIIFVFLLVVVVFFEDGGGG
jgi:hypothetical protein